MCPIDKRIETREITTCEICHYFMTNLKAVGDSAYSCDHPDGPGGKLTLEFILKNGIHPECPLPKVGV